MGNSKLAGFIIDCQTDDLEAASDFWSLALGFPTKASTDPEDEKYVVLDTGPNGLHIEVQKVDHPSRVHLDIEADDIAAEVQRLEKLGARQVSQVKSWTIMEAPTGHRFCVIASEKLNRARAFAKSYTEAWSSQDPASVAAHFAINGSLQINDAEPSVGRDALTATAREFMNDLPDLVLTMDDLVPTDDGYVYRWTLQGTHGASGNPVLISGYEEWSMSPVGLIAVSLGHMDLDDYQRQLDGKGS